MEQEPARRRRPASYADLTAFIDAAGGAPLQSGLDVAGSTAAAVLLAAQRGESADKFVTLADTVGIDTLGALWRHAEPVSLPGALWALYLLRQWCRTCPSDVVRLWRSGYAVAHVDAAVAGLDEFADDDGVRALADDVLRSAYAGDFAVALERAAALFRVVAQGRTEDGTHGADELADRNQRAAADLSRAAALWRRGELT